MSFQWVGLYVRANIFLIDPFPVELFIELSKYAGVQERIKVGRV